MLGQLTQPTPNGPCLNINEAYRLAEEWLDSNRIYIDKHKIQVIQQYDYLNMDIMVAIVADITDQEWFMFNLSLVDN